VGYFFVFIIGRLNFLLKKISTIHKIEKMKISVILFVLSLFAISASAQIERKPVSAAKPDSTQITGSNNKVDKQTRKERMRELDLTKEQKSKLKEIMQSGKAAKEAIKNDTKLSDEEKKKQNRALQKAQMQKIQTILTPEQLEKFKASVQHNP
jgi:Spy/CpxP family protein refolding chaperone